jgi:hypothetical protein
MNESFTTPTDGQGVEAQLKQLRVARTEGAKTDRAQLHRLLCTSSGATC